MGPQILMAHEGGNALRCLDTVVKLAHDKGCKVFAARLIHKACVHEQLMPENTAFLVPGRTGADYRYPV